MNKHQQRTEETRALLLKAAEEMFVRDGYEGAQLNEISALAGRTKGAVYAHFKNKEDLFLGLFELRTHEYLERLMCTLNSCATVEAKRAQLRKFFVDLAGDRSWPILNLEFKLYALRHPQSKERLRKAYEQTRLKNLDKLTEEIFGLLDEGARHRQDVSAAAVGPIVQGLILESHFEPDLLSEPEIRALLDRIYDMLFGEEHIKA